MSEEMQLCDKCGINPAGEQDYCPYDEQILDKKTLCNCCEQCIQNCLDEI